ncbi:MAG: hypothetical protein JXR48_15910 [Candidatus Delongbacteria bacterium]|nr:hypothetical protein [Candidatus Delongbacteria bacterium]MBN2836443.1 hypothetical protein [Candidatus Delongbacteria bacterium]
MIDGNCIFLGENLSGKTQFLDTTYKQFSQREKAIIRSAPVFFYSKVQDELFFNNSKYENNVSQILEISNISTSQECYSLSGGEKQILNLCCHIASGSKYLFIDDNMDMVNNKIKNKIYSLIITFGVKLFSTSTYIQINGFVFDSYYLIKNSKIIEKLHFNEIENNFDVFLENNIGLIW